MTPVTAPHAKGAPGAASAQPATVVFVLAFLIALGVALALGLLLFDLPPPPTVERAIQESSTSPGVAQVERGRAVFSAEGCQTCHAIGGQGNPRYPLDGVGGRRTVEELRQWVLAAGAAQEALSAAVVRRKQRYAALPEPDLAALVAYLATLRDASPP